MAFKAAAYEDLLAKNGVPREQARAHALAVETFIFDEQVTKQDLEALGKDLRTEISGTRQQLDARINQVESKLEARIDQVESKLEARIDQVESKLGARIDQVETKLGAKIDQLEVRMQQRNAELKFELVRWMGGIVLGTTATVLIALWRLGKL